MEESAGRDGATAPGEVADESDVAGPEATAPGETRGRFIVLEGPDGAGKSVQASRLAWELRAEGHTVTLTREPGGTRLGEQVRHLVLDPADVPRGPVADALLFNAARSQLVSEVINPALERGDIVVCDRYATSTLAYQGYGSGLDLAILATIQRLSTAGLLPDLVVLLDVSVETGLARRDRGRAAELTRFEDSERHDLAFHRRVRQGYQEMASADPGRWAVVDGEGDEEAVASEVREVVASFLARRGAVAGVPEERA